VSPDGKHYATGGEDNIVRIWEIATAKEIHVLAGHEKAVTALAYSPDGTTLVSGAEDTHVISWDVKAGKAKQQIRVKTDGTEYPTMVVKKDGRTVVAWTASRETSAIDVYDLVDGKQVGSSYNIINMGEKKD